MNNSDHNSNGDFDSLQNQAISDAQLDELLDLAQPTLDPKRQQLAHQQVAEILETSRGDISEERWTKLAGGHLLGLLIANWRSNPARLRLAIAVCGSILLAWVGWSIFPTAPTAVQVVENASIHDGEKTKTKKADTPKTYPPITSQKPITKANRKDTLIASQQHAISIFKKPNAIPLRITIQKFEATLLKTAGSKFGLFFAEQFSSGLEQSAIALQTSLVVESGLRPKRRRVKEVQNRLQQIETVQREIEFYLTACLTRLPKEQATDAFRILCRVGSQRSLPTILQHWNHAPTQSDAVKAVKRWGNSRLIVHLITSSVDPETQTQLMAALLCQSEPSSVDSFLRLTAEQGLYSVAQKCGATLRPDCSPVEILIQRLRSNRTKIARAAAITLAEMNDPRISEYLVQLALRPESARPAVMALTARTDTSSVRFIELAATDARWSATVINERKKWRRLLAVN